MSPAVQTDACRVSLDEKEDGPTCSEDNQKPAVLLQVAVVEADCIGKVVHKVDHLRAKRAQEHRKSNTVQCVRVGVLMEDSPRYDANRTTNNSAFFVSKSVKLSQHLNHVYEVKFLGVPLRFNLAYVLCTRHGMPSKRYLLKVWGLGK